MSQSRNEAPALVPLLYHYCELVAIAVLKSLLADAVASRLLPGGHVDSSTHDGLIRVVDEQVVRHCEC